TSADAALLHQCMQGTVPIGLRAPLVPLPRPEQSALPGRSAQVMLFLGDYRHHPNVESARVLATEVLPLLRRQARQAQLWLAGPYAGAGLRRLAELPGVRVMGFVAVLPSLLRQVLCLVAPVFSGGGVRIKVLTAL